MDDIPIYQSAYIPSLYHDWSTERQMLKKRKYLTEIQIEYTYVNNRNKTSTTVKHPIVKDEILMIKRLQQIYTT